MNNNMVVTLKSSTTEMELNSVGSSTYIIPDLEGLTSLPEIRSSVGVNAGADGGWTSAQYFNARLISMHLVIANEDITVVEQTRQKLNSILAQGRAEELVLSLTTEGGSTYDVNVRTSSVQATMNTVLKRQEFLIQFRADDPIIYGSTGGEGIEAVLRVQQAFGGFEIPFEFPLAINGGLGDTVIDNIGSETVYPVITMYGDLHSPKVINRTTNQQMKILADIAGTEEWSDFQTLTGDSFTINDAIDNAPIQLDKLNGNATQTGTPSVGSPVPIETVVGKQTITLNSTDYEIELGGRNLIDESALDARVTSNSFSDWYYYNANLKAKVTAGKTYTLSMKADAVSVTPYDLSVGVGSSSYAADVDTKSGITTVGDRIFITFTPTQAQINSAGGNTLFMRCPRYTAITNVSYTLSQIKLEEGDTMTAYTSYMQAPIELAKVGTAVDYIWNNDGTWTLHKETGQIASYAGETITTSYISTTGGLDTGATVYYALTTATDTPIVNVALVAQLDAINEAKLLEGTNTITLTPSAEATGVLDLEYATNVTRLSSGIIVIDSLFKTVTLNGTDIYNLIDAGSSFLEIAPGENHLALESEQTSDNGYAEVKYKQGFLSI